MILHTAVTMEQTSAMAPTQYPILLLRFEFPLSSLQRGHMHECMLPVQRLVMPAGVDSSRLSCLAAETATYDCFSSSYLSISGMRGCDVTGRGRVFLVAWLDGSAAAVSVTYPHATTFFLSSKSGTGGGGSLT